MPYKKDQNLVTKHKNTVRRLRFKKRLKFLLFSISVCLNAYLLFNITTQSNKNIIIKTNISDQNEIIQKIYDLSKYKSVSRYNSTIKERYDRLTKMYNEDVQNSKESHYFNGQVNNAWSRHCKDEIRRIIDLESRISDFETITNTIFDDVDSTNINNTIKNKDYDEHLSEMSNFYAGFIDERYYNYIVQSTD